MEPQAGVERQTLVSSSGLAYVALVPVSALAKGEGSGGFEVAEVISGVILRGFENEGEVGEGRVADDAGQSLDSNLALAEVPVAIDEGAEGGARVVEVNGVHAGEADRLVEKAEGPLGGLSVAPVVAGGEGVGRVEAHAHRQRGAEREKVADLLEGASDLFALTGGVLEENGQRSGVELVFEPAGGGMEGRGAGGHRRFGTGAAGAPRVEDEVVGAEEEAAFELIAKSGDRLVANLRSGRREVDEVARMDDARVELGRGALLAKAGHFGGFEGARRPAPGIAREDLPGLTALLGCALDGAVEAPADPGVEADPGACLECLECLE